MKTVHVPSVGKHSVMLVALVVVVTACGRSEPGAEPATSTSTTTTTAAAVSIAPPTTAAFPAPGPLGAVVVAPGDAIQIRTLQMISGPAQFLGIDQVRGVELALEDFGDVLGHSVDLGTGEDDLCSSDGGRMAAESIVAQPDVIGVIGTTCSGAAATFAEIVTGPTYSVSRVAAAEILSDAGMVLISGSSTSPALTSDLQGDPGEARQPGYLRTAPNDVVQGAAVATFAIEELGLTRAAVIHGCCGRLGDSVELGRAFADAFEAQGGTITLISEMNLGDTDMVPLLTEIAAGRPEVIYLPIYQPEAAFILQQRSGVAGLEEVVLIGVWESFMSIPEAEGMYFSGPQLPQGANVGLTGLTYHELVARYQATYGEAPIGPFHAYAYDATLMLLSAIEEVAIEAGDGALFIDRQELRDALYETKNFPGITGTLSCDQFGDCGSQTVAVYFHEDATQPELTRQNIVYSYTERLPATIATDPLSARPPEGSTIAVLGCSNTKQHACGYTQVSEEDQLRFGPNISGLSLRSWARPNSGGWGVYDRIEPDDGYTAAWFQICLLASEHDGTMSDVHKEHVTAVVEMIRARSGDIPIYLSPSNFREPDQFCNLTGPDGPAVAATIADWAAANLENVHRGPTTGPLSAVHHEPDGCHLSDEGELLVGQQLVKFFDQ